MNHRALQTGVLTAPVCLTCGKELPGRERRRIREYCDSSCRNRAARLRPKLRPFVGLDGEGEGNRYILLADSRGRAISNRTKGLSTTECLDYLLALPSKTHTRSKPIYVWFAFDYDVNMILGDIPLKGERNSIEELRATGKTKWHGYRIRYIPRKILFISDGVNTHTSYDVWGFFQTTFENASQTWGVDIPPIITEGKAARDNFSRWPLKRIKEYNTAELQILVQLCNKLRESVKPLDLRIQSWHGPGAFAKAWLSKNKVKEWKGDTEAYVESLAALAYFGGRIDASGYGCIDPCYHYDIVSAYPAAICKLPRLSQIEWRLGKRPIRGRIYLAKVSWNTPASIWPPFPWRNKQGTIRYPRKGQGWYWYPEVEAAIAKFGNQAITIHEVLYADGNIEYLFDKLISSNFQYRRKLKNSGNIAHFSIKLILNSLYGSFAQTVGKATYRSLIWAGLITSHTRAKLLEAITDDCVCVMTDSLWSKSPLDVNTSGDLGAWEFQDDIKLWLAEAGLYESLNADGERSIFQRGFDRRQPVDIESLVSRWLNNEPDYEAVYNVRRFVGMGLASQTSYPWRTWVDIERRIKPVPFVGTTKRYPLYPRKKGERISSDFQLLIPRNVDEECLSYPYQSKTFDEKLIAERLEDECMDE